MILSCSAEPQGQGFCAISCSGETIAPSDYKIEFIGKGEDLALSCEGIQTGNPYPSEVPLRFRFLKKVPTKKGDSTTTDTYTPVSGIDYEVVVVSGRMAQDNPTDPAAKYRGILTPMEEWCTDSCGVGGIDLLPTCLDDDQTVSILVRSGAVGELFNIKVTGISSEAGALTE